MYCPCWLHKTQTYSTSSDSQTNDSHEPVLKGTVMVKFLMICILTHSLLLFLLSLCFSLQLFHHVFISSGQQYNEHLSLVAASEILSKIIHQSTHCTKPPISNTKYLCSYKLIQSLYNLIITVSEDSPSHLCNLHVCTAFKECSGKQFNPRFSKPRRTLSRF